MLGVLDRLPGAVDVVGIAASDGADLGGMDVARDQADRLELWLAGDGEAAVERVEAHLGQRLRDLQLLLGEVVDARRLLAIAQRGLEKLDDAGHGICSFTREMAIPAS